MELEPEIITRRQAAAAALVAAERARTAAAAATTTATTTTATTTTVPGMSPSELLDDDEIREKYDTLKKLECGGTELIKFSSLKYVYSLISRLDSSATEGQKPDTVIVEFHRKESQAAGPLPRGAVEIDKLPSSKSTSPFEEPLHKVPRVTSPQPPQKSQQQNALTLPSESSFTGLLESLPEALANNLRRRQHACQEAATELHNRLSKLQSNVSQIRSSHIKFTNPQINNTITKSIREKTIKASLDKTKKIVSRSALFGEIQTLAPSSGRRVAVLRSLYKSGGLRAVAASHDFLGGLVDVKFEPTGRYPIILGASACEEDRTSNVGIRSGHTAIMYNYITGETVAHNAHGMHTVSEVDFLRNGTLGFTAGYDGHIYAWKVNNPSEPPERLQISRSHKTLHVERLQASKYHDLIVCSVANVAEDSKGEVLGLSFCSGRSSSSSLSNSSSNSASTSFMMSYGDSEKADGDLEGNVGDDGLHGINGREVNTNSGGSISQSGEGKFEVFRPFDSHKYSCNDITFGGTGLETWVLCACKNGTMMAGDINTGNNLSGGDKASIVFKSDLALTTVACSTRTRLAVFGDESGVVRAWDPRMPTIAATSHSLGGDFNCMSFNPSDMLLQCSTINSSVYVFDVRNFDAPLKVLRHDIPSRNLFNGILMSRWSPSGFLFSCGEDTTLRVWDLAAGDPLLRVIRSHKNSVACVAISPDESVVVSGDDSKRLVLHTLRGNDESEDSGYYDNYSGSSDSSSMGYDRFAGAVGPLKLDC